MLYILLNVSNLIYNAVVVHAFKILWNSPELYLSIYYFKMIYARLLCITSLCLNLLFKCVQSLLKEGKIKRIYLTDIHNSNNKK